VNIAPSKDGLVHVSGMATEYVQDANDIVKLGDVVHVRVSEIQDDGKIKLTMLTPEQEAEAASHRSGGGSSGGSRSSYSGGGDRGGYGGSRGGSDRGRSGGGSYDRRGGSYR